MIKHLDLIDIFKKKFKKCLRDCSCRDYVRYICKILIIGFLIGIGFFDKVVFSLQFSFVFLFFECPEVEKFYVKDIAMS